MEQGLGRERVAFEREVVSAELRLEGVAIPATDMNANDRIPHLCRVLSQLGDAGAGKGRVSADQGEQILVAGAQERVDGLLVRFCRTARTLFALGVMSVERGTECPGGGGGRDDEVGRFVRTRDDLAHGWWCAVRLWGCGEVRGVVAVGPAGVIDEEGAVFFRGEAVA